MTLQEYYGKYFLPVKMVEEKMEISINKCLEDAGLGNGQLIKYTSDRIKSPDSVEQKLKRKNLPSGVDSAIQNLNDVVGVRIVVRFVGDIYTVRDMLRKTEGLNIIRERDYISTAKESGYRSYHIITETEIDGVKIHSEIQIRTMAMDCWASLEHRIRYKKNIKNADLISLELKKCSECLISADATMEAIRHLVIENKELTD